MLTTNVFFEMMKKTEGDAKSICFVDGCFHPCNAKENNCKKHTKM